MGAEFEEDILRLKRLEIIRRGVVEKKRSIDKGKTGLLKEIKIANFSFYLFP